MSEFQGSTARPLSVDVAHAEVRGRRPSLEARTAVGRCIGRVASFEARVRSHLRMRGWGGSPFVHTRSAMKRSVLLAGALIMLALPQAAREQAAGIIAAPAAG